MQVLFVIGYLYFLTNNPPTLQLARRTEWPSPLRKNGLRSRFLWSMKIKSL